MRFVFHPLMACVVALSVCAWVGCDQKTTTTTTTSSHDDEHEHGAEDHHHDSLPEAMTELATLRDQIAKAFADGEPKSADDQLHHAGDLLTDVEELVKKSELSDDAKKTALASVETLFTQFKEVDNKVHGDGGKDYSEVSEAIEAAMKSLGEAIK
ncbi:hypothetical protein [Stieleria varia]|uniref:Uncharacterized protein n=1 Tax=Stieleria varia TaxID=2528005 RepID=A0A5C6B2M1_9BACT|nr:hypothetical protein [Stieleria varia]TWU05702.1 hypothetical protein Pla52n_14170 [Stieleria varia]